MKAGTSRWGLLKSIYSFQENVNQGYGLVFPFNLLIDDLNTLKDKQAIESCSIETKASILYSTAAGFI